MAEAKNKRQIVSEEHCAFKPVEKDKLLKVCWCTERCLIGKGAYAIIYKGLWKESARTKKHIDVAIKLLQGPYHVDYEIATLKKVYQHPNILKYYGEINLTNPPSRLIVTELCSGTLHDLVNCSTTLDFVKSDVLRQIVLGVKHLHDNNIVHRDLKPKNILYCLIPDDDDRNHLVMKLADFGCSRSVQEDMSHYTRSTIVDMYSERFRPFGTDGWLAPEVLNVVKHFRPLHAIDIYPLGLVFAFTLCGGQHPFSDDARTRNHLIKNKESISLGIMEKLNSEDRIAFELIESMLNPDPMQRPSAADILKHVYFIPCENFALGPIKGCRKKSCVKCFIGKGGFGLVFRGQYYPEDIPHYKINVAIKKIYKAHSSESEIEILRKANHENILSFCCAVPSQDKEFIYIATVLCAGTLSDLIVGKYQGPKVAESDDGILHQITKGLNYLHNFKPDYIIHRDLKPENILISMPTVESGKPVMKLADFGFSRIASNKMSAEILSLDNNGDSPNYRRPGTPFWAAPEIRDSSNFKFTKKSDIFPLGLIFVITMSRGRHAFDDYDSKKKTETAEQCTTRLNIRENRMYKKKEKMAVKKEDLPDHHVYNLIVNMLNHDPKKRPTTEKILKSFSYEDGKKPLDFTYIDSEERQEKENKELFDICRGNFLNSDALSQLCEWAKHCRDGDVNKALLLLCEYNQSKSLYEGIKTLLDAGKEVDISVTDTITGNNAVMFLCEKCPPQHLLAILKLLLESPAVRKSVEALTAKNRSNHDALQILCERQLEVPNWLDIITYISKKRNNN